jgi:hypothetical protein
MLYYLRFILVHYFSKILVHSMHFSKIYTVNVTHSVSVLSWEAYFKGKFGINTSGFTVKERRKDLRYFSGTALNFGIPSHLNHKKNLKILCIFWVYLKIWNWVYRYFCTRLLIYNKFYPMIFQLNVQILLLHQRIFYTCWRTIILIFGWTVNGSLHWGNHGRFKHKELANQRFSHYTLLLILSNLVLLLLLLLLRFLYFKLSNVKYITFSLYFKQQTPYLFIRFIRPKYVLAVM